MENKPIIVLCTTPDFECAQKISLNLIEKNLAACCNMVPGMSSIYRWQNKILQEKETMLVIKSTQQKFTALEIEIKRLHPFEVPEIISIDISDGSAEYLNWIISSLKGGNED